MIPVKDLDRHLVCVEDNRKFLSDALRIGGLHKEGCRMPVAIIVDDRKDVSTPSPLTSHIIFQKSISEQ